MKRFEEQIAFQPAAQSQGFAPVQAPDVTGLLRQNNQARLQEAKAFADARMSDLKLEEQALKYQELLENEQVERLADFSSTLSETLVAGAKLRNEQVEQFYMMQAYTDGLSQEESATFDAQEKALQDGTNVVYDEAAKLEAGGLSVDVVDKVRNLSGWAKYGYMRGLAEQGGANYGTFFTNASTTLKVNAGGREFTLAEANTGPERAAAKAAIAEAFLSQYKGMSPGLLNKYLFPAMKKWEQSDDLEFAERQRDNFEKEKKAQLNDDVYSAAVARNGQQFLDTINLHASSLGGRRLAIEAGLTKLHEMAKLGIISKDDVNAILSTTTTRFDNGKEDTLANIFGRKIALLDFEGAYSDATKTRLNRENIETQAEIAELDDRVKALVSQYEDAEGDLPVGVMKQINERYYQLTGKQMHPRLQGRLNDEDASVRDEVILAEQRMAAKGDVQYLTASEFADLSLKAQVELKRKYGKIEVRDTEQGLSTGQLNSLKVELKAMTQSQLKGQGITGASDFTQQGLEFNQALERYFFQQYKLALQSGADVTNEDAYRRAIELTKTYAGETVDVNGVKTSQAVIDSQVYRKNALNTKSQDISNRTAILNDARGKNVLTQKVDSLAGTTFMGANTPMAALKQWVADGGKGSLPPIFRSLAIASGVEGISAWDVASAQYEMHTGKKLSIPKVEENIRKLPPGTRLLLTETPTPARTTRAALMSGGMNKFADLVGFHESSAHGGYDAMNRGGSGRGVNNRAVGSANSKEEFGIGLQEMTVGEVLRRGGLHYSHPDFVFAAGRYQFIPKTLRWVVEREGIPLDAKFDKNTQDFLFASQVRWRLSVHSGKSGIVQGLRDEWQGLHHASEQSILDGVEYFEGSPFNDPAYLHPALLQTTGGNK